MDIGSNVSSVQGVEWTHLDFLADFTDLLGDLFFDANGTGEVVIPDDSFFTFGTSKDAKIEYDEDGSDLIQVTGVKWRYNVPIEVNELSVVGVSTLNSSGGITTTGGDLYVGGDLFVLDDTNIDELTSRNLNVTGIATCLLYTSPSPRD